MRYCPGVFDVLAIDVLFQAAWRSTWHGWFWAQRVQTSEKQQKSCRGYNSEKICVCLSLLLTRWLATHRIVCSVPQETHHLDKADFFHFTAHSLWCNIPDLIIGWGFRFTASRHLLPVEIMFPVPRPGRAHCWTLHVLTWPRRLHVIWLQGAQFWCNYTSFELLMPWKIFTQVSRNHSGTAVDTELHTARHTPAVGHIIFLQRCSGDPSVSSLAHQLMKFGWMKTTWLCIMKGFSIIFIKKCTLSFNFHKIPKIISDELELVPLFLSRIFCCVLCILYMCYESCESFHAL